MNIRWMAVLTGFLVDVLLTFIVYLFAPPSVSAGHDPTQTSDFIMIALGSANETLLWCRFAKDLGYIDAEAPQRIDAAYSEIARMLSTLAARNTSNA